MSSAIASSWSPIDGIIQKLRFGRATKFISNNPTLVDIGCGSGAFLKHVEPQISQGIGLDGYIKDSTLSEKIKLKKCIIDKDKLPLEDGTADVVTALAVLEHLQHPEQTIQEVHRILRKGGKVILTTPSPAGKPVLEFLAFRCGVISKADIEDHKHYFSHEELKQLFSEFSSFKYHPFQFGLNQLVLATK